MSLNKTLVLLVVVAGCFVTGLFANAKGPTQNNIMHYTAPSISMSNEIHSVGLVRFKEEVDLPAKRSGQIRKLNIRRGDTIHASQLVGSIDNSDALAQLAAREAEFNRAAILAKNTAPIRTAQAAFELAKTEVQLIRELGNDVAYLERYRVENSQNRAASELENAKISNKRDLAAQEVAYAEWILAKRDVAERQLVSPVEGVVTEVHRDRGEWVQQGERVLTAIRMDRMLVEGFVSIQDAAPYQILGATASVSIEIAGAQPINLDGLRITKVAAKVDLDGKYMVWTEIANKQVLDMSGNRNWLLRPGMNGTLTIQRPDTDSPTMTASLR